MLPEVEWRLWRQLKGAFKVSRYVFVPVVPKMEGYALDQYDTMEEALASCHGKRAFLEPTALLELGDMPNGDIIFVFGNTAMSNKAYAEPHEMYRIRTEGTENHNHLCGSNAAAIALATWYGQ
jgi:hypothetical protein